MELPKHPLIAECEFNPEGPEVNVPLDDPELEREFQELAEWLLDIYIWKLQQERKSYGIEGTGMIDNHPRPSTI